MRSRSNTSVMPSLSISGMGPNTPVPSTLAQTYSPGRTTELPLRDARIFSAIVMPIVIASPHGFVASFVTSQGGRVEPYTRHIRLVHSRAVRSAGSQRVDGDGVRVVVVGGSGNFGARICRRLAQVDAIEVVATSRRTGSDS